MGMVFTDGFDSYADSAALRARYRMSVANSWAFNATAGRFGGGAVVFNDSVSFTLRPDRQLSMLSSDMCLGFWMKLSSAPAANTNVLQLESIASSPGSSSLISVAVATSGVLRHNSGTPVNGTTNVADNNWHWVELHYDISPAIERLYVDEVLQWDLSQSVIPVGSFNRFGFLGLADRTLTIDDIMAYNDATSGSPLTSDFPLGMSAITTMRPAADDVVQFNRSSGPVDNADAVNEVSLDENDWVDSSLVGAQDLYFYDWTPPSPLPATIHTAMLTSYLVNPDIGQVQRNHVCSSRGTQQTSSAARVSTVGRYYQTSFPEDPYTTDPWESDALGDASFGIRVAS